MPTDPATRPSWFQNFLALVLILGFLALIAFWTLMPPKGPEAVTSVLISLVGSLGSLAGAVVGWYFGSSRGSSMKDQALVNALNAAPPPAPPSPSSGGQS